MINEKSLNSINESERKPKKELYTEKIHDNLFFCLQEEYNRVSGFFNLPLLVSEFFSGQDRWPTGQRHSANITVAD